MLRHPTRWLALAGLTAAALWASAATSALAAPHGGNHGSHGHSPAVGHAYRGSFHGGYRAGPAAYHNGHVYRPSVGAYHRGYAGYRPGYQAHHGYYGYRPYYRNHLGYRPYWGGYGWLGTSLATWPYYSASTYPYPAYDYNDPVPPFFSDPVVTRPALEVSPEDELDDPAVAPVPPAAEGRAQLRLHVPADAVVWANGVRMTQTGAVRDFESPPLTPGKDFSYTVRARWMTGRGPQEQTREVGVRANQLFEVFFPDKSSPQSTRIPPDR